MGSEKIEFDEEKHEYKVNGEVVPSVTTILDMINGHYADISKNILDNARRRGTLVHEATEMVDYGCEPDIYPEISKYVQAYIDFEQVYVPEWKGIETITYCNQLGYIGTVDRYGKIAGRDAVVDIKTNSSPTKDNYLSVCLQTSAYAFALGIPGARRYAVYLKSDGSYRVFDCEKWEEKHKFDAWNTWLKILELYKEVERIKK